MWVQLPPPAPVLAVRSSKGCAPVWRLAHMTAGDGGRPVPAGWEHFEHGADIGIRGYGSSLEEAFEQAALALTGIAAEVSSIRPTEMVKVHCDAPDIELLLVSWLNAIIHEMAVRGMVFGEFRAAISGLLLEGTLAGEKADPDRHSLAVEPKGATVTGLKVERGGDGRWVAQCVIDV